MNVQTRFEQNEAVIYGGFWIRVGAYFIDMVVLLIPVLFVSFLFRAVTPATNEIEKIMIDLIDSFLSVAIWWIYFAVLHSSAWQASIGKKVLGLKVVDEDGFRISFGRATGRYFAEFLSAIIFAIGYMMIGWTKKKQGLHDILASTLVIRTNA